MCSCVPNFEAKSLEVEFCHLAFGITKTRAHVIYLHGTAWGATVYRRSQLGLALGDVWKPRLIVMAK